MKRPRKGRAGRDLWGAAKATTGSAKLLVASQAPLVAAKVGNTLVVGGELVKITSITKNDNQFTITAEAVSSE